MKHKTTLDNKMNRLRMERVFDAKNAIDSKPENSDPKAYSRFKAFNTDYGSGKKCEYGDKMKSCDPSCRFWLSCIKGRHGKEDTDDARSNTASKNNTDK